LFSNKNISFLVCYLFICIILLLTADDVLCEERDVTRVAGDVVLLACYHICNKKI
jgi:hypothetical protein